MSLRRVVLTVAALAGLALPLSAAPAAAQPRVHRFVVDSVADNTFLFRVDERTDWLRAGATGIAVDPARRDALVARFRVVSVSETRAMGDPTLSTVERPTSRSISLPLAASRIGRDAAPPELAGVNACGACACGTAARTTMMYTTSAAKKAAGRRPCKGRDRQN